jgi:hypothetical protein
VGAIKRLSLCVLLGGALSAAVGVGQAVAAPPTAVTCGSTIAAPGQYYLAGDCGGGGITIAASDVHLKLDGHTITGPGADGIFALGVSRLDIQGPGTITGYQLGMELSQVTDSHVEKVTTTNNHAFGVAVVFSQNDRFTDDVATSNSHTGFAQGSSSGIDYDHVTASNNTGRGISIGLFGGSNTATHIDGSTANGNGVYGIELAGGATANHVNGNTALGNTVNDLADQNAGCDSNVWEGNHFATANQSCIS